MDLTRAIVKRYIEHADRVTIAAQVLDCTGLNGGPCSHHIRGTMY